MVIHWVALLLSSLSRKISAEELRRVVAHWAPSRSGVLGIPWATTRAQLPQLLPKPLAKALDASPGGADHLVQVRSYLFRIPTTFTFYFYLEKEGQRGFSGISLNSVRPCPHAVRTLSELFGSPVFLRPLPDAFSGHPEIHTLWVGDGFEVVSRMTTYGTGGFTFELPHLSLPGTRDPNPSLPPDRGPPKEPEDRDGSSPDRAIVVSSIIEEREWVTQNCRGFEVTMQAVALIDERPFDILTLRSQTGETRDVYFDISAFFISAFFWR